MLTFRISENSVRIPVALIALELTVFVAAVLATAYLELFPKAGEDAGLAVWLLRAGCFSAAMIFSMTVFKLYQGRPNERMGMAMLRLGVSFLLAVSLLQVVYLLIPLMRIEPAALATVSILSFFFLSTVRPVFLDSVTERRGRRRNAYEVAPEPEAEPPPEDENLSQAEFLSRVSRNAGKPTSLTGQHRITRRGL